MNNAILADLLAANNIGEIGIPVLSTDFGIFLNQEPKEIPINCITIYNYDGGNPDRTYNNNLIENTNIQIRVRSNDVSIGYKKIKEIQDYLDQKASGFSVSGDFNTEYFELSGDISELSGVVSCIGIFRNSNIINFPQEETTTPSFYINVVNYSLKIIE